MDRARNTFPSGGGRHVVLIDLPPALPPVLADRRRIVQVLNNLFANAARHAPESSPIRVAAQQDGVHVAVSVSDEGRGVAPDRLAQLFQKYTGADDAERGLAGTGLHPQRARRRLPHAPPVQTVSAPGPRDERAGGGQPLLVQPIAWRPALGLTVVSPVSRDGNVEAELAQHSTPNGPSSRPR